VFVSSNPKADITIMKRKKYFFISLLVLNTSILFGQSKNVFQFADNKHSLTIPFELSNSHIYVNVKINSSKTLSFLFDNGAGSSGIMIDSTLASEIGLQETGKVTVGATGGQGDFLITDSVSLTIDKLFIAKQKIAWLQLKEQEKEEGHKIDGILSYSFFKHFVFAIDYKNKMLTITDPQYYSDKNLKNKIPMLDLDNNKVPIVKGVLTAKSKKAIKAEFIFDTGHDEYIVVGKEFIIKNKLSNDTLKIQPERVNIGLGGQTIHKSATINSFNIGTITIVNPNTVFSFDEDGYYSTLDGVLLGGQFFKNYKLILNYPKKYLVLTKS
jgi:Aspartyl protease